MEAMLFLMGFTSIISVYEIAKSGKTSKNNQMIKDLQRMSKKSN